MLLQNIKKLFKNEYIKYIIAGGLTTLISLLSFYCFIKVGIDYKIATIFSFVISATFTFFSNKIYVFKHKSKSASEYLNSYCTFMTSRLFTLAIDFFGMILLVKYLLVSEMISKIILNVIIFILNYIISKIIVFRNKE